MLSSIDFGNTGLKVSRLGFGTFDLGSPSLNISPEEGGQILAESYKLGLNFWDTSDDHGGPTLLTSVDRRSTATLYVLGGKNRGYVTEEPAVLFGQNYILSTSGETAAHLGRHLPVDQVMLA